MAINAKCLLSSTSLRSCLLVTADASVRAPALAIGTKCRFDREKVQRWKQQYLMHPHWPATNWMASLQLAIQFNYQTQGTCLALLSSLRAGIRHCKVCVRVLIIHNQQQQMRPHSGWIIAVMLCGFRWSLNWVSKRRCWWRNCCLFFTSIFSPIVVVNIVERSIPRFTSELLLLLSISRPLIRFLTHHRPFFLVGIIRHVASRSIIRSTDYNGWGLLSAGRCQKAWTGDNVTLTAANSDDLQSGQLAINYH